jgi:hypothetical protein
VVEHSIGNGEVDSSILSGSTIFSAPHFASDDIEVCKRCASLTRRRRLLNIDWETGEAIHIRAIFQFPLWSRHHTARPKIKASFSFV